MYSCDIALELTESVEADVRVHFHCWSTGCPGDAFNPPEGPQFEVDEIEVLALYGGGWEKQAEELCDTGFYHKVREVAEFALDAYDELYEHQHDAYENYEPEPYWD